jgi:hypothetical protein
MALTKLNNKAIADITALPSSVALGDMVLVSSATASGSATIDFTLGDYKEYQFYFVNMHTSADDSNFEMNFSTDNGSNYNVTKTSTYFFAYLSEDNNFQGFRYEAPYDLAQGTGFQTINNSLGLAPDNSCSGFLTLSNPSSNTYVKHFIAESNSLRNVLAIGYHTFVGGYANTVSPLTNIRFKMSSGNIDSGTILMYGIN